MEEEKVLTPQDAEFLPVQYNLTEQRLAELANEYDPDLIPSAEEKGDEGYLQIHAKVMDITKVRTNVEKVRKDLKKDALEWGRKVDGEAKRLTAIVEDLEAPWRAIKTDLDEKEAREAAAAAKAEAERMDKIEGRIAEIKGMAEGLIGADAATIQSRIDKLNTMVVSVALFAEYQEAAKVTGDIVLKSLQSALAERQKFDAEKAELETAQAKLKEEQDAVAAEKASQEAAKAEKEAEAQRKAEVKEAAQRAVDAAEARKKDAAKMKERLPQDREVQAWADRVVEVLKDAPDPKDQFLKSVVTIAVEDCEMIINRVFNETQGGE